MIINAILVMQDGVAQCGGTKSWKLHLVCWRLSG